MAERFAIVTGASSGIGYELALICAREGLDLLVAADRPEIDTRRRRFAGKAMSRSMPCRSISRLGRVSISCWIGE